MLAVACPYCRSTFAPTVGGPAPVRCPMCGKEVTVPAGPGAATERWFYVRDKHKSGPASWQELCQAAQAGQLGPADMVLREGASHWVEARTLVALFETPAGPASPSAPSSPKSWLSKRRLWAGIGGGVACVALVLLVLSRTPSDSKADPRSPADSNTSEHPGDPVNLKLLPVDPGIFDDMIRQVNHVRGLVGMSPVSFDIELNRGCQAHARYVALNPALSGLAFADEDSSRAGYSSEGKLAARNSVVHLGHPAHAFKECLGRGDLRLLLLDRHLLTIGLGVIRTKQDTWVTVLDYRGGRNGPMVLYPADGQKGVTGNFSGGPELPGLVSKQNAGFPVSVTLPPGKKITGVQARLIDDIADVPTILFTPDKVLAGSRNAIGLIPKAPLVPETTYRAEVSAHIDGRPWSRSWSFSTGPDFDRTGDLARKALDRVNHYRKLAGLAPVELHAELSTACRKHAQYLARNFDRPEVQGEKAHDEFDTLPGFSEEGRRAGKRSDITQGEHDPLMSVDSWMATLYHRVPLLDPRLSRVGFSCARGPRLGWVSVLDVFSGREKGIVQRPIVYPVDGQRDVPLQFPSGGEIPDPIPNDKDGKAGYPITVTFPEGKLLRNARASFKDGRGQDVPVWFSSPEKPANPKYVANQANTICLIAQDPLQPSMKYSIHLQLEVDGRPYDYSWSFTTGPAGMTSAQAAQLVLERMNHYRNLAGLPRVTLDAASSFHCEAHVRYLQMHHRSKQLTANDEDPSLPGYTAEGQKVGRRADIFFRAPVPVAQIDTLMAGFARRSFVLDPTLRRIGFACLLELGEGWICVLDLHASREDRDPIVFPAPEQTDVPVSGADRVPDQPATAAGFPITVNFPAPVRVRDLSEMQVRLLDSAGRPTNVHTSTIEPGNTVHILPRTLLRPGTTYQITVSARVPAWGETWRQSWRFTTRAGDP